MVEPSEEILKFTFEGLKLSLTVMVASGAALFFLRPVLPVRADAKPEVAVPATQGIDFFETKIRPLFANKCAGCHGPAQMGGLRVDSLEALLKGGETGPALTPGDPDKSLLIQAVRQTGTLKMPKGGHLKPEEIASLETWVKMGAPWPKTQAPVPKSEDTFKITPEQRAFWSFRPLALPAVPKIDGKGWAKSDIDRLVAAKLEAEGLQAVGRANKRTLIRRASFDLTGLPPTPEEVDAFEKDKSSAAFEKLVDRLLASPRYGERWGRRWLDVARYAEDDVRGLDPKGRGYMPFHGAYVYRDWVISAMNADMPYDQFVKAQLAGDLVDPKDRPAMLAGTAFLGQGPWIWDQAVPVQGRADERNERIDAITRGFLGLTVACARCHNHKYDPISQKDYYALGGVIASTTYHEYPRVSPAQVAAFKQKEQKLLDLEEEAREFGKTESEQLKQILAHQTSRYLVGTWRVLGKPKLTVAKAAEADRLDTEMLDRWVKLLSRKTERYPYLRDFKVMIAAGGSADEATALGDQFQALVLDIMTKAARLKEENDVIKAKADVKKRSNRDALPNEFETMDQFCPGCELELKTLPTDQAKLWMDLFLTSLDSPAEDRPDPGLFVFRGWGLARQLSPAWKEHLEGLKKQVEEARKSLGDEYPFVHGVEDKTKPVNIQVNLRGSPFSLGDEVPRRFLAVLASHEEPYREGSGRLQLANDIIHSPLAARVIVNRVWKWHFGTGIVNTPDNFGVAGEKPSNPELLEYLAARFVSEGMSIKKLNREIMLSQVYQLGSDDLPANDEKDAANRFYWRFNKQRLEAESIRDSILFVAGDLDLKKTSGPSVEFAPDTTSRTVFCKVSRFRLNNYLQVFDFPNPSFTAEQRFSTNVPLQRLFFMNDQFVFEQATLLAERVRSKPSDTERIQQVYRILYGRAANPKEIQLGLDFLNKNPERAGEMVAGTPPTVWREYARVLLSSNEFEFVN